MKVRETDRLINAIARSVQKPNESLKDAEKDVRQALEKSAYEHNLPLLIVARGIWKMFKNDRNPRKIVNGWCKDRLGKISIAEFDYHVDVLKRYQKNARNLEKLKGGK